MRASLPLIVPVVFSSCTIYFDQMVVRSNRGRSVTCARVPGQNTTTNCPYLLGCDTKNRRPLLPGVYARGSKRPHSGYINVTCSGLTHSSISRWHWLWASCAHHRLRSAVLHDTNMGAHPLRYYAVGCLTTSRHKAVCS